MVKQVDLGRVMGKSSYEAAVTAGYKGTEQEYNAAAAQMPAHITNKENPHGVTAAQVGARPSNWVPSKADIGLSNVDNVSADGIRRGGGKHLAGQGTGGGYSFAGDGSEDTGMFSDSDGDLYFMINAQKHPLSNFVEANGGVIANINNEINSLKTSVANGKAQIASAISDKGVSTGANADFGTMANNIRAIATGNEVMAGEWPDFSIWHGSGKSFTIPSTFSSRSGTIKFYGRTNIQISGTSRNAAVVGNVCYRGNDGAQQGQLFISQNGSNLIITVSNADSYDYYNLFGVFVKL